MRRHFSVNLWTDGRMLNREGTCSGMDFIYFLKKYLFLVALGLSHDTWASLVETCGLSSCGPQT